jgi:hypothetical protein
MPDIRRNSISGSLGQFSFHAEGFEMSLIKIWRSRENDPGRPVQLRAIAG